MGPPAHRPSTPAFRAESGGPSAAAGEPSDGTGERPDGTGSHEPISLTVLPRESTENPSFALEAYLVGAVPRLRQCPTPGGRFVVGVSIEPEETNAMLFEPEPELAPAHLCLLSAFRQLGPAGLHPETFLVRLVLPRIDAPAPSDDLTTTFTILRSDAPRGRRGSLLRHLRQHSSRFHECGAGNASLETAVRDPYDLRTFEVGGIVGSRPEGFGECVKDRLEWLEAPDGVGFFLLRVEIVEESSQPQEEASPPQRRPASPSGEP